MQNVIWNIYATFVSQPKTVVTIAQELGQSQFPSPFPALQKFPLLTRVYFQFVFGAITIIILAGLFFSRMSSTAWIIFMAFVSVFSISDDTQASLLPPFSIDLGIGRSTTPTVVSLSQYSNVSLLNLSIL